MGLGYLGRYELIRVVGQSNDIVYEAWDPDLNRRVAVKELQVTKSSVAVDEIERRERFIREGVLESRIHDHSIVATYDVGTDSGKEFLVLEFVEAPTLSEILRIEGALDSSRASKILIGILDGLSVAHGEGIIHRDIKPANIFVLENDQIKIGDFGIAKLESDSGLTRTGTILGSVQYMSPEQVDGGPLDGRTDLWSAGVVFYEMLTGLRPFEAPTITASLIKISRADFDLSIIDDENKFFIQSLLQINPNNRPATARKAMELLNDGPLSPAVPPPLLQIPSIALASAPPVVNNINSPPFTNTSNSVPQPVLGQNHYNALSPRRKTRSRLGWTIFGLIILIRIGVAAYDVSQMDRKLPNYTSSSNQNDYYGPPQGEPADSNPYINTTNGYHNLTPNSTTGSADSGQGQNESPPDASTISGTAGNPESPGPDHPVDQVPKTEDYNTDAGDTGQVPNASSSIEVTTSPESMADPNPWPGELYPLTRQRKMTQQDLIHMGYNQFRYAINEIYARHGYVFRTGYIQHVFNQKSWYVPDAAKTIPQIEREFSEIERSNNVLLANAKVNPK